MAKNLKITLLYDIYGDMLTEKQQEVLELYYNEDLSLAEIAEHLGVTRQGVSDSIKRGEHQLLQFEEVLLVSDRLTNIRKSTDKIAELVSEMSRDSGNGIELAREINLELDRIREA